MPATSPIEIQPFAFDFACEKKLHHPASNIPQDSRCWKRYPTGRKLFQVNANTLMLTGHIVFDCIIIDFVSILMKLIYLIYGRQNKIFDGLFDCILI